MTLLSGKYTEYFFLLLVLCASLILFVYNLGEQYLWQDEAQTALISKTVLERGLPFGYDGKNFFSQEVEAEYGKDYIWKWHTWLPFYIVAGFFGIFGVNTFSARLAFALFGIGSVFMTYFLCKSMWQSKRIAVIAVVLLIISVPFLILSRQCRYYSMAAFFCLWGLQSYVGLIEKKKYCYVTFVLSLVLLFHTHYLYCAALLASAILHSLAFHRERFRIISLLSVIVILVNVPWILWLSGIRYSQRYGRNVFILDRIVRLTKDYLLQIGRHIFSPLLLLIVPAVCINNRIRNRSFFSCDRVFRRKLSLFFFFTIFTLIGVVFTSPWFFFRYLAPLIPVFAIIAALLIDSAAKVHPAAAIVVVIILLFTGGLGDFIYEISHDYDGPIEGIVKYLNEHGLANDIVFITYGDMPLKFYTDMRVVGGLTGEDLPDVNELDWVIVRRNLGSPYVLGLKEYLKRISLSDYREITIDYPDITYENSEDPGKHRFRTAVDEEKVIIFQKIRQ